MRFRPSSRSPGTRVLPALILAVLSVVRTGEADAQLGCNCPQTPSIGGVPSCVSSRTNCLAKVTITLLDTVPVGPRTLVSEQVWDNCNNSDSATFSLGTSFTTSSEICFTYSYTSSVEVEMGVGGWEVEASATQQYTFSYCLTVSSTVSGSAETTVPAGAKKIARVWKQKMSNTFQVHTDVGWHKMVKWVGGPHCNEQDASNYPLETFQSCGSSTTTETEDVDQLTMEISDGAC